MGFTGSTSGGNVVSIRFKLDGTEVVTRKIADFRNQLGQLGTMTMKTNQYGAFLGATWKANATMADKLKSGIGGLALRFVGLQAAVRYAEMAIHALVDWGMKARQEFRDFEKRIAEVSTILVGDLYPAIDGLTSGVNKLSIEFGQSANDLAEGLYEILSAAVPVEEAMNLLTTATKASIAGLTDVATSVDVFTSIMNAWGMSASEMNTISDQLFQTVVRGKLRFEDLASAMGYIAPIAANLGVEFKEIAAALSTVTRQGQHVDMATRGLALGIQNIADITPKAAKAAEEYGVDLSAVALRVGGLEYILEDLNDAMKKHGTKILPEMISNMRSLRVFMALAGEGLEGYKTDLELLNDSAGRTEEALSKMMRTAQFEADVLQQQMELLERSIGQAWHNIDIWWKKTQLWWGTFLSTGNWDEANKAVSEYQKAMDEVGVRYFEMISSSNDLANLQPFNDLIMESDDYLGTIDNIVIGTKTLYEHMQDYLNFGEKVDELSDFNFELNDLEYLLKSGQKVWGTKRTAWLFGNDELKKVKYTAEQVQLIKETIESLGGVDFFKQLGFPVAETVKGYSEAFEIFMNNLNEGKIVGGDFRQTIKQLDEEEQNNINTMQDLYNTYGTSEDVFEYFRGGLETLSTEIANHQQNILDLQNAIADLKYEVSDVYKTLAGTSFTGHMKYEVGILAATTQFDRFQEYAQMAIKYGDEMNTSFMNGIKGTDDSADSLGKVTDYLNWYNKDIWETVQSNTGYSGSLQDLIEELGNYTAGQKEAQEESEEYKKQLDELSIAMRRTSLEIMKIQLKGMKRRHGLTRGEEQKIKKLQIQNMEDRIKQMEIETSEAYQNNQDQLEDYSDTYDELRKIFDEYVDRVNFDLWQLKDGRNSDIEDFINSINTKKERLETYEGWLQDEIDTLEDKWETYTTFLQTLSESDVWGDIYNEIFGVNYLQDAIDLYNEWKELVDLPNNGEEEPPNGEDGGGGGGGEEPPKKTYKVLATYPSGVYPNMKACVLSSSGTKKCFDGLWHHWSEANNWLNQHYPFGSQLSWKRGSYFIPRDDYYPLHKGETVSPAGRIGGKNITIHVDPINVNAELVHSSDVEDVGNKIGQAIAAGFISGVESEFEVG